MSNMVKAGYTIYIHSTLSTLYLVKAEYTSIKGLNVDML